MTAQGEQAAAIWRDTDFARGWAQGDSFRDLLDFPRRMAAAIVAGDNPAPAVIVASPCARPGTPTPAISPGLAAVISGMGWLWRGVFG